jgi:DNA primase
VNWLASHLQRCSLNEDHAGYFLGRGAKEESIVQYGIKTWERLPEVAPCEVFQERYGNPAEGGLGLGEWLEGWAIWPLNSPRGKVLGFEGRKLPEKKVTRYLLPEAGWQPLWFGLTPEVVQRIWDGADVWIVEGLFDLFAMQWAVPEGDVVLASLRAKLTDKQVEFLRRFCKGMVHMVYDNDEAGKHGVHGFIDEKGRKRWGALQQLSRVEVKVVNVDYRGKDPGEIWNQKGVAGIRAAFPR